MEDQAAGSTHDAHSLPKCYRHPDRETGVHCTRCDRPICPECMVSASVGFQCPECVRGTTTGQSGPPPAASRPRTLAGGTVTADPRLLTKILIGVNIAIFLVQVSVGDSFTNRFDLIGQAWFPQYGAVEGVAQGQYYRMLTAMFLHDSSNYMHIVFNILKLGVAVRVRRLLPGLGALEGDAAA
ncbi:hypothetical protein ABZ646_15970, partial [Streptomyces sp. NPDC007162]